MATEMAELTAFKIIKPKMEVRPNNDFCVLFVG